MLSGKSVYVYDWKDERSFSGTGEYQGGAAHPGSLMAVERERECHPGSPLEERLRSTR